MLTDETDSIFNFYDGFMDKNQGMLGRTEEEEIVADVSTCLTEFYAKHVCMSSELW